MHHVGAKKNSRPWSRAWQRGEHMTDVSIIIPVYNVEEYLPSCLDSVLSQTLRDIEVICVDDASPDRCPEILDAYAAKDPRIKVIHLKQNSQQAYARNRGMEIASGKYIYLLDSDDLITPEAMKELYDLAERDHLDGIFFDSKVIYDNPRLERRHGSYITSRKGTYPDSVIPGRELFDMFIEQEEWTCYIQRQFWNRAFLVREGIQFPEGHEHEDEVFPFEAILLAERVRYIPAQYFIRRFRDNSVVTSPPAGKNFYGYFMCYLQMIDFLEERGIASAAAESNVGRMYERMLFMYEMLHEKVRLEDWTRNDRELRLYRYFEYTQKADRFYQLKQKTVNELLKYRTVYIYGAGMVARKKYRQLIRAGFPVKGFLVTDMKNNPDTLFGRPVCVFDETDIGDDAIVVTAVSDGFMQEITALLDSRDIHHIRF